ncbi:hypothetical protein HC891_27535, partial [Candidatus Gracilibacteria bacterium]|nr:hypothetical protein [Candidatus Gracilibacteria bacterium]
MNTMETVTPPTATKAYLASLPERAARALVAISGGFVYEMTTHMLPAGVRHARLYQATIERLLRILVEGVGGVQGVFVAEGLPLNDLVVRKAAGNAVELASFLAVGWSPVWLLAAVADITGGTRLYLQTLVGELEASGALPTGIRIDSFEGLLSALEGSSGTLAD